MQEHDKVGWKKIIDEMRRCNKRNHRWIWAGLAVLALLFLAIGLLGAQATTMHLQKRGIFAWSVSELVKLLQPSQAAAPMTTLLRSLMAICWDL